MRGVTLNAVLLSLALTGGAQAAWQDHASARDVQRIAALAQSRAHAMADADRQVPANDLAAIRAVLNRPSQPTSLMALGGIWRCRSIKLGGMAPDVIYAWFTCKIAVKDGIAHFEKHTGTQHYAGTLYPYGAGRFVLLAGMNGAKDHLASYSGRGAHLGADASFSDAVGVLTYTGGRTARIEFPDPAIESAFDIIEMKR